MAELSGYGGGVNFFKSDATTYVLLSDATYNIHSWSADVNADALEVTSFADAGNRTYIRGLKGWTATCEAYVDGTNFVQPSDIGVTGRLTMYISDTLYYYGNAVMTGFSPAVSVDAVETQTMNFQGTGELTFSDVA